MEEVKDLKKTKREYMREYKRNKKLENAEYEKAIAKNYNKISYDKKVGKIDQDLFEKYSILYPNMVIIKEQLHYINLLDKNNVKNDIIKMLDEILG
jgi:hypothetical protein